MYCYKRLIIILDYNLHNYRQQRQLKYLKISLTRCWKNCTTAE